MYKVVIIDDEPLARSIVAEYLQSYPSFQIIQECNDGFEGLKAIQLHKPDLVFLDVQMPKITGFEMIELIDEMPSIIFTTAFDQYALQAFEAHAIDYLLKPFSKERFEKAVQKWILQKTNVDINKPTSQLQGMIEGFAEEKNRIVVKTGNNIKIIPTNDILYFEADDDYVKIFTNEGYYLKKKTMNHFEKVLDPNKFIRAHRSYIIHLQELTKIEILEKDSHIAILKNGSKIPLSKSGYLRLKEVLEI